MIMDVAVALGAKQRQPVIMNGLDDRNAVFYEEFIHAARYQGINIMNMSNIGLMSLNNREKTFQQGSI
jgi:hypothetical protein